MLTGAFHTPYHEVKPCRGLAGHHQEPHRVYRGVKRLRPESETSPHLGSVGVTCKAEPKLNSRA